MESDHPAFLPQPGDSYLQWQVSNKYVHIDQEKLGLPPIIMDCCLPPPSLFLIAFFSLILTEEQLAAVLYSSSGLLLNAVFHGVKINNTTVPPVRTSLYHIQKLKLTQVHPITLVTHQPLPAEPASLLSQLPQQASNGSHHSHSFLHPSTRTGA